MRLLVPWNTNNFTCNFFAKLIYVGETPILRMKTCDKNLSMKLRLVLECLVLCFIFPLGSIDRFTRKVCVIPFTNFEADSKAFRMSDLFLQNQSQICGYHQIFSHWLSRVFLEIFHAWFLISRFKIGENLHVHLTLNF